MLTAPGARGPLLHASPNEYIVLGITARAAVTAVSLVQSRGATSSHRSGSRSSGAAFPAASLSPWPSKVRRLICHGWKRCTAKEANPFLGAVLNETLRFSCLLVSPASVLPISAVSHPVRAAGSRIARNQGF